MEETRNISFFHVRYVRHGRPHSAASSLPISGFAQPLGFASDAVYSLRQSNAASRSTFLALGAWSRVQVGTTQSTKPVA